MSNDDEKTYTTNDGATIREGDGFWAIGEYTNELRARVVGRGRPFCVGDIPTRGSGRATPKCAYIDKRKAIEAMIARAVAEVGAAEKKLAAARRRHAKAMNVLIAHDVGRVFAGEVTR